MGKHKHVGYNLLTVIPACLSVLQRCFVALEFLWREPGLSVIGMGQGIIDFLRPFLSSKRYFMCRRHFETHGCAVYNWTSVLYVSGKVLMKPKGEG